MITIINLTPHPVTIVRVDSPTVIYPACKPEDLPRALESAVTPIMELDESGDGQAGYANRESLDSTGLVDHVGYTGISGLPEIPPDERAFGCVTFRIVSIVTAIGALAAGRDIVDLLVPMGQVRDAQGRIVGASGLAPASALLTPLVRRWIYFGVERGKTIGRVEGLGELPLPEGADARTVDRARREGALPPE